MKRLVKSNMEKEEAKQVGIIYHFTDNDSLIEILNSDSLSGFGDKYVSFTRDKNFNRIKRKIGSTIINCALAIDGDKLSDLYKIEPYNDELNVNVGTEEMESEERVKSPISPVIPYILNILLFDDLYIFENEEITSEDFKKKIEDNYKLKVNMEKGMWKGYKNEKNIKIDENTTIEYIKENKDKIKFDDWHYISENLKLPTRIIRELQDKVDWESISQYQALPMPFIREFQDKVYWYSIFATQILSEAFIREFQDKLESENAWPVLQNNHKINLSPEFKEEFKDKLASLSKLRKKYN